MKTILLIAGLILTRVSPAQNSPPDTTKNFVVVKNNYTKEENKEHALTAVLIISTFVVYMFWFVKHQNK